MAPGLTQPSSTAGAHSSLLTAIRDLRQSIGEPGVELGHQRRGGSGGPPFGWRLAIDAALDVEQGIETLRSVERDRAVMLLRWPGLFLPAELTTSASSKNCRRACPFGWRCSPGAACWARPAT